MNDSDLNPSREESAPHLEELADLGLLERTGSLAYEVTPETLEHAEEFSRPAEDLLNDVTKALIENLPDREQFYRELYEAEDESTSFDE